MTESVDKTENIQKEPTFTKQQLVASRKYAMQRDVVSALLEDDKSYTFAEVDKKITAFLGKRGKGRK